MHGDNHLMACVLLFVTPANWYYFKSPVASANQLIDSYNILNMNENSLLPFAQAFISPKMANLEARSKIDPVADPNTHMMARRSWSIPRKSIGLHKM